MNLAQCIPAEWAQEHCPQRHKPRRPPEASAQAEPPPTRKLELLQEELDERQRLGRLEQRDPVPAPAPQEARRMSEYPWRRGKGSLRYRVLVRVGRAGEDGIGSGKLYDRLPDKGATTLGDVCATLRHLVDDKYAERSGTPRLYRYRITELGRKALDA